MESLQLERTNLVILPTPDDDRPGLGEVSRSLARLEAALASLDSKVDAKLVGNEALVHLDTAWALRLNALEGRFESRFRAQEADVAELRSWLTWGVRLVLGLVVTAIVAGVIYTGGVN